MVSTALTRWADLITTAKAEFEYTHAFRLTANQVEQKYVRRKLKRLRDQLPGPLANK
jgi:hypothetical protein